MSGSVIERAGTQIIDGFVCHDDRPMTWSDADLKAGRRLDRRKCWAFVEGQLCESVSWSNACSGCYEGYNGDSARGMGCDECGYQGRVRNSAWVPTIVMSNPISSSVWNYRCICGKRFTETYGLSGAAYCPKVRCQLVCTAVSPVATPSDKEGGE